jgi:exopolysaccharide biosynthesis polyprenyl glycosylphosphotransferase
MTRRHLMTLRLLLVLADAITAFTVFLLVSMARFEADPTAQWSVGIDIGTSAVLFAAVWVGVFLLFGAYRLRARFGLVAEARDIASGTIAVGAVTLAALFLLHQDDVSRLFLALLFLAQPVAMLAGRVVLRRWFESRRRHGRDINHMLVVGTGPLAQDFADRIEAHHALGLRVIGHLGLPNEPDAGSVTRPVLGSVDRLSAVFHERVVDEVGVCLGPEAAAYIDPIVTVAADEGKTVRVPRPVEEGVLAGALQEEFDGYLVQSVVHDGQRELERAWKRVIDLIGASLALVLLSPLIIGTALAIRVRDGSPVLFRQVRTGRHGRPFTIYKFRTMVCDAEDRYAEVAAFSDTKGAAFKMDNDPRVTQTGRFVRKWTLDELPQLFNVIKGDMSLVGPRPAPPREVAEYDIWHRRRLSVRPGMTGLWQVEARFDEHFDDRAVLDLRYIDQWSLLLDLGILAKTIPAVLQPRGR